MKRFPRRMKRIKRPQIVERPIKTFHPEVNPELFGPTKESAKHELKVALRKNDWLEIRFDYKSDGMLVVYGKCFRDEAVLDGAKTGQYDLYGIPLN